MDTIPEHETPPPEPTPEPAAAQRLVVALAAATEVPSQMTIWRDGVSRSWPEPT